VLKTVVSLKCRLLGIGFDWKLLKTLIDFDVIGFMTSEYLTCTKCETL